MARDDNWQKQWIDYINGLCGLRWMPNEVDSQRVGEIMDELKMIVKRNHEGMHGKWHNTKSGYSINRK